MTDFKYPGRGGPSVDDIVRTLDKGDRVWLDLDTGRPDCGYCSDEAMGFVAGVEDDALYVGRIAKTAGSLIEVVETKPYRIDEIRDICVIPYQVVLEPDHRQRLAELDAWNREPPRQLADIEHDELPLGLFEDVNPNEPTE